MIRVGHRQALAVLRINASGAFLGDPAGDPEEAVLMPGKFMPAGLAPGARLEVFVYQDGDGRPLATPREAKLTLDGFARLRVVALAPAGAFLDWGLEKDLLLPRPEWRGGPLAVGDEPLVALGFDRQGRLCASMRIDRILERDSPYRVDDEVAGTVYRVDPRMGAFVAVDDRYHGLIPGAALDPPPAVGDRIRARVVRVLPDGKLDLALRARAHRQMEVDAAALLARLEAAGGFLPLHDRSAPAAVKAALGLGKAAFKRAVGRLYKAGLITLEPGGIRRVSG